MWGESVVHAVGGNYASWGSDRGSDRAWVGRTGAHWARMARPGLKQPQASPANCGIEANQPHRRNSAYENLPFGSLNQTVQALEISSPFETQVCAPWRADTSCRKCGEPTTGVRRIGSGHMIDG
jgi:hypothetical protein